jgi:ATP-dependent DNA helicase RecQ
VIHTGYHHRWEGAAAARAALAKPGVEIAPRKLWPTGMSALGVALNGKIPASESAETGRALGRLTDLGWGNRLRDLLADGTPDQPLPEPMVDGIVKVLAAWDWKQRPTAVVSIGSHTRPGLITDTARRIAAIGRLEYLGTGEPAATGMDGPGGQARRGNSAQRLKQGARRVRAQPGAGRGGGVASGPDPARRRPRRHRLDDDGRGADAAAGGADEVLPFALALEA